MWPRAILRRLVRQHRPLRSFSEAVQEAGGISSGVDRGTVTVPTEQIVGSVSRWQNLRSDFLYRTGTAMTRRFLRIGELMAAGKELPAIDLYKLKGARSEYYVVDGHHRVAMARRLGQDFMDARVREFRPAATHEAQQAHALRRVRLFKDASADELVALWRGLTEARVSAGDIICQRGEREDRLYIVHTGSVEVRLGIGPDSTSLNRLGPGDCFGEMALLTGEPRSADVLAVEDSVLWALDRQTFDTVVGSSLPILRALNRVVVQRLARATAVIGQAGLTDGGLGAAGLRFGPYRVVAQIGSGGMAVVYSAVHESTGMAVALKVLPASWGEAAWLRERLSREAEILRGIQHPGVVRLLDIGEVSERLGGGTFIAMEWLPDALDRELHERYPNPLPRADALRIAGAVAEALAVVHAAGLVHRDVKPSNILLRATGEPVLTDFGVAAVVEDVLSERRLTPPSVLVGTADYLAPEVISGEPVTAQTDIYALGIVLYEMLSGFVPFAGREPTEMLRAHCEEAIPPLPAEVPVAARQVVERAVHRDAQQRFSTANDMARAIAALR
jgi:hypothetical protein